MALEVTRAAVREVRAQETAIADAPWDAPGLTGNWTLWAERARPGYRGTRITDLKRMAPGLLSVLEHDGVERFGLGHVPSGPKSAVDAVRRLRELGVEAASSPGRPAASGNAGKLAKADAGQRHLIVWTDRSDPAAAGPVFLGRPPADPAALPGGVDAVWVAAWAPRVVYHCYAPALWRATRGGQWQTLVPPDVLGYVEQVTGDGAARGTEDSAFERVRLGLTAHGEALRRCLRNPG